MIMHGFSWICAGLCCSLLALYIVHFAIKPSIYASTNELLIAAKVRDVDEVRLSHSISQIGEWTLQKRLPLNARSFHKRRRQRTFNIIVLILSSPRPGLDAFEPQYLTQTVTHLLIEIEAAPPNEYPRFGEVTTTVCATEKNISEANSYTNELARIKRMLGGNVISPAVTPPSRCTPLTDMQACLQLGVKSHPLASHIVVLEDDFLVTKHFLPTLHKHLQSFRAESSVMQLYVDSEVVPFDVGVQNATWLLYFASSLPLLAAMVMVYFRVWPNCKCTAVAAILGIFGVIVIVNHLSGDAVHLTLSSSLQASASGAALVLPRTLAMSLAAQRISIENCSSGDKRRFIGDFLKKSKYTVLAVRPPAVTHIGMYSSSSRKMLNPLFFPH